MKRKLTAAQQAQSQERKANKAQLFKDIQAMNDQQKESFLKHFAAVVTTEGHQLSPFNSIACIIQGEDCDIIPTIVGGFNQWKKEGRQVKKGSKGLAIYIPCSKKETSETGEEKESRYFTSGYVFDISQTEPATTQTTTAENSVINSLN